MKMKKVEEDEKDEVQGLLGWGCEGCKVRGDEEMKRLDVRGNKLARMRLCNEILIQ